MNIPKFHEFMKPLLIRCRDGNIHKASELFDAMADDFRLSDEERNFRVPGSNKILYKNRIRWAISYLLQAKLLTNIKRGEYKITGEGLKLLAKNPDTINQKTLLEYPDFAEFVRRSKSSRSSPSGDEDPGDTTELVLDDQTPDVTIENAYVQIKNTLMDSMLMEIMNQSPAFFEQLVCDLLLKMGYGGSARERGRVVGGSNDEGIDGIIEEDKLGFDKIYFQAKRWDIERKIDRSEIQKFVGALSGQGASKGLFITTASFSKSAIAFSLIKQTAKVVLVDGRKLAELMFDHDIGVSPKKTLVIKELDTDYFRGE